MNRPRTESGSTPVRCGLAAILLLAGAGSAQAPASGETVRFRSGELVLAGELIRPTTAGRVPAVVLIHGSGPDEAARYRLYAERFAEAGIASLVYDKRGAGASGGDWRRRTLPQLAGDARAAVRYLRARDDIDSARVGFWGISQGSWVAAYVAARSPEVAFVVTVAGDGVSPTQQEMYHKDEMFRRLGYSRRARNTGLTAWKLIFDALVAMGEGRLRPPDGFMEGELSGGYFGLDYDPVPDWRRVRQPVLLVYGENDRLTPRRESIARITRALAAGGNGEVQVAVFPGASHTITTRRTGLEFDWDSAFAPGYLDLVTRWMRMHTGLGPSIRIRQPTRPTPSRDFAPGGRYGELPWYGRYGVQLFAVTAFALSFLAGLVGRVWRLARGRTSDATTSLLAALVCALDLALLAGLAALVATAFFKQGMSLFPSYAIPPLLRILPLVGIGSALLTLALFTRVARGRGSFGSVATLVASLLFLPFLAYWNLVGPPF
jgi:uncharacterized protein